MLNANSCLCCPFYGHRGQQVYTLLFILWLKSLAEISTVLYHIDSAIVQNHHATATEPIDPSFVWGPRIGLSSVLVSNSLLTLQPQCRDNFTQGSTHQTDKVTSKERNTGEHRELQVYLGQQSMETQPHKQGPLTGLRKGTGSRRAKVTPMVTTQPWREDVLVDSEGEEESHPGAYGWSGLDVQQTEQMLHRGTKRGHSPPRRSAGEQQEVKALVPAQRVAVAGTSSCRG